MTSFLTITQHAFLHHKKTPASNALPDLIRTVLRMNTTVQKSGTRLMRGTGITNARWQMLSELCAFEKRVTVSELARHMGLTLSGTITSD